MNDHLILADLAKALPGHTFIVKHWFDEEECQYVVFVTIEDSGRQIVSVREDSFTDALNSAIDRLKGAALTRDQHAAVDAALRR